MNIAVSGFSGLIGSAISQSLMSNGYRVVQIQRHDFSRGAAHLASLISGCKGVVHLAGAPVLKRWTAAYKVEIMQSRRVTTSLLVDAISMAAEKPECFLCASAVGIYKAGVRSTEMKPVFGDDFLSDVCQQWELAADKAKGFTRVVKMRFGVVLSTSGGALPRMLPLFKMCLGGTIGSGNQPFPWIHINDLTAAVSFILSQKSMSGGVNMVSPHIISNSVFTKALAKSVHRFAIVPVPAFALHLLYGEGAKTLTTAPEVAPEKLIKQGFLFQYSDIQCALDHLVLT